MSEIPRGVRNKNRLNVKSNPKKNNPWLGQIGEDGGHAIFIDDAFSYRAALRDIAGDILIDGKDTLRKLFAEYAPKDDPDAHNDPDEYAKEVGVALSIDIDSNILMSWFNSDNSTRGAFFGCSPPSKIYLLLEAMTIQECGKLWVPPQVVIRYGIFMYNRDFTVK